MIRSRSSRQTIIPKMESRSGGFVVNFVSSNGPLIIFPSIDKSFDGIVMGKANQTFTINIVCKDEDSPFAAKLFIDCQEVVEAKTFKKRGNFFGFRCGGGRYEQFVFKIPEFIASGQAKDQTLKDAAKKMGEIRIIFFKAHDVWKKFRAEGSSNRKPDKPKDADNFVSVPMADSKACPSRSLSVSAGREFQMPLPSMSLFQADEQGMVKATKPDLDSPVDQIVLRYSNPATLMALGLVSPFNQAHWKFIPKDFLTHNEAVLAVVFQQMRKQIPQASFEEIRQFFVKSFNYDPNDVCLGGLKGFIEHLSGKPEMTRETLLQIAGSGGLNKFCIEPKSNSVKVPIAAVPERGSRREDRAPPVMVDRNRNSAPEDNKPFLGKRGSPTNPRRSGKVPPEKPREVEPAKPSIQKPESRPAAGQSERNNQNNKVKHEEIDIDSRKDAKHTASSSGHDKPREHHENRRDHHRDQGRSNHKDHRSDRDHGSSNPKKPEVASVPTQRPSPHASSSNRPRAR